MKTFIFNDFIQATYDSYDIKSIATHGCASYAPNGMTSHHETSYIYDEYAEDLHNIIDIYTFDIGETPKYITDNLGNYVQFKNAVVWFCAEAVCQNLQYNQQEEVA
tara:strand:- start:1153 stop:1470 length:318 start_codon:yes stop_codon:yes gene_type:complete